LKPIDIPFNKPYVSGRELEYVAEALALGHLSGDGKFTRLCSELLQSELGADRVLLTTSCTHALEMAALLLDLKQGDEFIVPSFTFVSTANAFVLRGARPVFVDIREDTLNLDEARLADAVTSRTRAILPVHYAGVGCEMDAIMKIANEASIAVVEDNAHGLFAAYRGKKLGTFGALATQSFHETKNFSCGEGGALVINDPAFVESAEIIREKGTDRSRFFRGQVDKYTWVSAGSSYLPSEILAAFLWAQLEAREIIQKKREAMWRSYDECLRDWANENCVRQPFIPAHCDQAFHMYYLMLPSLETRTDFIAHLRSKGILAVFHYVPLHLSNMGRALAPEAHCPVTEHVSDCLVRLPFFNSLEDSQRTVIEAVKSFKVSSGARRNAGESLRK
jgi:dTDP-4-amino-4,6-dideoxygalactose transaminase